MKLKKSIKIFLVIFIICGIAGGFYFFNQWFFNKYKDSINLKSQNEEVKKEGKEIIHDNEDITSQSETKEKNDLIKNDTVLQKKTIDATVEYYCEEGYSLEKQECVTILEMNPTRIVMSDGSSSDLYCKDESYTLKDNKCIKETRVAALRKYSCPNGYVLNDIFCEEK